MTLGMTIAIIVLVIQLKACDGPEECLTQWKRLNCDVLIAVLLPMYIGVQFVGPIANIQVLERSILAVFRHSFYAIGVAEEVELRQVCI